MEILRFVLFLVTSVVLVKVGEDVILNWQKDTVVDIVPDDTSSGQPEFGVREDPDDLTAIEGIKSGMVPILNEAGYISYSDIELANIEDLKRTIETSFPQVTESELKLWAKQASYAVQGRTEELEQLKRTMLRARTTRKIQ